MYSTPISADFFKMGRLATAIDNANDEVIVLFGGSNLEKDCNDVLVIKVSDFMDDSNFVAITEIM